MGSLGPRLKELRTAKGIIQGDLGEIVGVKTSEISGYEIGTRNPSYDVLIRIADYFEVTTDYLIGRGEKQMTNKEYSPPLDEGIKHEVEILAEGGIETYESCEGGIGHCFTEPTVRFHGHKEEGFKALAIALQNGLKPSALRRIWTIIDGEPVGPDWEMTFTNFDK